jgi:hypothetical protein
MDVALLGAEKPHRPAINNALKLKIRKDCCLTATSVDTKTILAKCNDHLIRLQFLILIFGAGAASV